jgi:DNA-binding NtrC family response regulator
MQELVFFRLGVQLLRLGLGRPRTVLGSGESSDVVLPDPDLSGQHVAFLCNGTRCFLEDLSGKGLLVAGQVMTRGELLDGMDIALGQWRALFRERGSSESGVGRSTDVQSQEDLEDSEEGLAPTQVRVKQGTTEFLHELSSESLTLGTDPANGLVIRDRFISSRHLQVTRCETGFHVRDLGSTNGTFLGNARIFEAEFPLNTVLRVGETELHFESAAQARQQTPWHGIIGSDPAVRHLLELISQVAPSTATVTILGESGTGKELVARALHDGSPRAQQPFIPVNCAAISKELIESELFGHEKGAFTGADTQRKGAFAEAHGGTLFLDEIGELPLELQAKLLRALESGEIKPVGASRPVRMDVRVVAATHRDLLAQAGEGRFREDLYYRLGVVLLTLPPLRRRPTDIRLLAEHFLRLHAPRDLPVRFTPAALDKLQQHSWPGNVRELRNAVLGALLFRKALKIDAGELSLQQANRPPRAGAEELSLELPEGVSLEQMMQRVERHLVENTLRRHHHNKNRAAQQLGLSRATLFRRLKDWDLGAADEAPGPAASKEGQSQP